MAMPSSYMIQNIIVTNGNMILQKWPVEESRHIFVTFVTCIIHLSAVPSIMIKQVISKNMAVGFFFLLSLFLLAVGGQPHNLHPLQPRLLHCRPETSSKLPQKSAEVLPPKTSKEDSPEAKLSTFSWIASEASDQWGANGGRGNERVKSRK